MKSPKSEGERFPTKYFQSTNEASGNGVEFLVKGAPWEPLNYPNCCQDYMVFSKNGHQCPLLKMIATHLIEHKVNMVFTKAFTTSDDSSWYQKVLCMLAKEEHKQQSSY